MLNKEFKVVELNNGEKFLTIVFRDKQYTLLSTLFAVEAVSFEDWIRENILDVLQGTAEKREISGNICGLIIEKKRTTVYDMLAKDGMGDRCSVSTQELLSLMDEWHEQKASLEKPV